MKLYARLAFVGIRNNKQFYVPFFFTSVGMTAVFYIMSALADSLLLKNMYGGRTALSLLQFGTGVMAVFSLIFLYYTHSFLTRRRQREFGLYNILGMEKRHIAVIMSIETFITYAVSLILGVGAGMIFAKLAETLMLGIMNLSVGYEIIVSWRSVALASLVFGVIFALILAATLVRVGRSDPLTLFRSESKGEKPPRANPVLGVAGLLLLAGAYYIAVTVENPIKAMLFFFIAVLMVIFATYFLFIFGSVLLCRILKRRKNYYYKENHFISVSSMTFRMKRNGAGLASICILLTMVLVTITSTLSLYSNVEDMVEREHPREVNVSFYLNLEMMRDDMFASNLKNGVIKAANKIGCGPRNIIGLRYLWVNTEKTERGFCHTNFYIELQDTYEFIFTSVSDYNESYGTDYELAPGEALAFRINDGKKTYGGVGDTVYIDPLGTYKIVGEVEEFAAYGYDSTNSVTGLVVDDIGPLFGKVDGHEPTLYIGFDVAPGMEKSFDLSWFSFDEYIDWTAEDEDGSLLIRGLNWSSKTADREDYMSMYGGLYFIGIMLSGVFTLAAVLIIYYKQITEGYEDNARFDIMRKVGLTKKQIKRSVSSQMRTVFIMPIAMASLHLAFAMPILRRMLMAIYFRNDALLYTVAAFSVAVCAAVYLIVYKLTASSYYRIVRE